MQLYLIRHGQTDSNVRRVLSGRQDVVLTSRGIEQARALGTRLRGLTPELLLASDLSRAQKTLAIATGLEQIQTSADLRERSFGIFEGRPLHEYLDHYQQSGLSRWEYAPPGGESYRDIVSRLDGLWHSWLKGIEGTAVIAAHGALNRVFIKWCLGTVFSDPQDFSQRNACVNILEGTEPGNFTLRLLDCTSHLTGPVVSVPIS